MRLVRSEAVALMVVGLLIWLPACSDDDGGTDCPAGETLCGDRCVNAMTDMTNCGDCGVICNVGQNCVSGICTLGCGVGLGECDGSCVDLLTDRDNCGDCDTMCGADEVCTNGVCSACDLGLDVCDNRCVDLQSDPDHCGDCVTSCGSGEYCAAGACGCGDYVYSDEAACQGCVEGVCCGELAACTAGTDCQLLMECIDVCGFDQICQADCAADYPDGVDPAQALVDCANAGCETECTLPGICGTELSYPSELMTQCVTDNCCGAFDPCFANPICTACMQDNTGPDCATDTLYADYRACLDTSCPTGICGTPIGYVANGVDPMFGCNICLSNNCCADMQTCVGDESQPAIDLCIQCLTDPQGATCTDPSISAAAQSFNTCTTANCATDCSAP